MRKSSSPTPKGLSVSGLTDYQQRQNIKSVYKSLSTPAKLSQKEGIAKFTGESHSYSQQRPQRKVVSRYAR